MAGDDVLLTRPKLNVETSISSYDKLNGILQATLLLLGLAVAFMFFVWLTANYQVKRSITAFDVTAEIEGAEGELDPLGVGDDPFEPGVEEFPEVEVPQLMNSLEMMTTAISNVPANSEFRDGDALEMGPGRRMGNRKGGGEGGNFVPEYKRWRIEYEAESMDAYVRQLSFFGIDIGAVQKDANSITRLRNPGASSEIIQTNREAEKKTLYFGHENRRLQQWDERILARSNVTTEGCLVVQFYSPDTREMLRKIEKAYLQERGRELKQVRNTFFKIVEANGVFEFQITDQIYR